MGSLSCYSIAQAQGRFKCSSAGLRDQNELARASLMVTASRDDAGLSKARRRLVACKTLVHLLLHELRSYIQANE